MPFIEPPVRQVLEQKRKNVIQVFSYEGIIRPEKSTERSSDETIRYIRKYQMDHGHAALIYELDTSQPHQLSPSELINAVNNNQPFDVGPKLQIMVPQLIGIELCHKIQDADGTDFTEHYKRLTIQDNGLRFDNEYRGENGAINRWRDLDADQLQYCTFLDNCDGMFEPENVVLSVEHCLAEQKKMMTAGLALRASRTNLHLDLGANTATFEKIRAERRRSKEIRAMLV